MTDQTRTALDVAWKLRRIVESGPGWIAPARLLDLAKQLEASVEEDTR